MSEFIVILHFFFHISVKVNGSYSDQMLMGVMLVVVPKGAKSERRTMGDPKVGVVYTRQGS